MSPPESGRAVPTALPSAAARADRSRASTSGPVRALEVGDEAPAGALADVEHLLEATRPTIVGVRDLGVGGRAGLERAQQPDLGPIAVIARHPEQVVAVRSIHRDDVFV